MNEGNAFCRHTYGGWKVKRSQKEDGLNMYIFVCDWREGRTAQLSVQRLNILSESRWDRGPFTEGDNSGKQTLDNGSLSKALQGNHECL